MSKQSLKTTIDANIKQNGVQAITGQIMNSVLNQMVDGLADQTETSEKLTELESKTNQIENEDAQPQDIEEIEILDNTGNEVAKINSNGLYVNDNGYKKVENIGNKVTDLDEPNDTTYPTSKAVADAIAESGTENLPIEKREVFSDFDDISIETDEGDKVAGITNEGIVAKNFLDLNGNSVIESGEYHLNECIVKPIEWSGKNVQIFGDSIASGSKSTGSGLATATSPCINHFVTLAGGTPQKFAVGGATLAINPKNPSYSRIYQQVLDHVISSTERIIIAGGTNDWNQGCEIGNITDSEPSSVYGALRTICEHIKSTCPNAKVVFVTPIPYTVIKPQYANIYPLDAYRSAIWDIATIYGHSVVDGKHLGMPNRSDAWGDLMCTPDDGCHPTEEGHHLYGRLLLGKLI